MNWITAEEFAGLKTWFDKYVNEFYKYGDDFRKNIKLKYDHSIRVGQEVLLLSEKTGLEQFKIPTAHTIALFHDVGRFYQLEKYGTYADKDSDDHAKIGLEIIHKYGVFDFADPKTKVLMLTAISYHNKMAIPGNINGETLRFCKLIRDADKLDILNVCLDYWENTAERNTVLELSLKDAPGYSKAVFDSVFSGEIARITDMQTINDFKLLQLGWLYDINFNETLQIMKERNYPGRMLHTLPNDCQIRSLEKKIENYLLKRIS